MVSNLGFCILTRVDLLNSLHMHMLGVGCVVSCVFGLGVVQCVLLVLSIKFPTRGSQLVQLSLSESYLIISLHFPCLSILASAKCTLASSIAFSILLEYGTGMFCQTKT